MKKDSKNFYKKSQKLQKQYTIIKPVKNLGQNFLQDSAILERIVQSIPLYIQHILKPSVFRDCKNFEDSRVIESETLSPKDSKIQLVEIGIGLGDLTKRLVEKYSLLAYEIDDRLIENAKQIFSGHIESKNLTIKKQDVMALPNSCGYLFDGEYFLLSNLPYYIATHIILRCVRDEKCRGFVVMTQKEVAKKFCSKSKLCDKSKVFVDSRVENSNIFKDSEVVRSFQDSKESKVKGGNSCALSVLAQARGSAEYLFDVDRACFTPQPKVDSAVFCFESSIEKRASVPSNLESILKYAFSSPRKRLFSNLLSGFKRGLKDCFKDCFIDGLHEGGGDLKQDSESLESLCNPCECVEYIFHHLKLDLNIRPHEVDEEQYCKIANLFQKILRNQHISHKFM